MSIPKPGNKVRGSTTGAPVNALLDLLGRRWALGILWSLGDGPATFRELQERCGGVSPSIMNTRIKDLRESGIVENTDDGYDLTPRGRELREIIVPLGKWAVVWSDEVFQYRRPGAERVMNDDFKARKER
ncbi:MAG TPA: helix-turn-helix domain-containing protein [Treponemataceae bacterium]|nr:helix-turn-helix domain-containing protein [Treponemataceae bacterium]